MKGAAGFTLMETMVAIAILALLGGMSYGTLTRTLDARERTTQISDRYHGLRQGLQRMAREIAMAYLSENRDCSDPRSRTLFLAHRSGRGTRLDFTSMSHHKRRVDAKESDENELSYFLEADPKAPSRTHLMRREQERIDESPQSGGTTQVLIEDVDALQLRFYDAKADRWEDDWDDTGQNTFKRLPKFVAIELTFTDSGGVVRKLGTKTRIFVQQILLIPGLGRGACAL